MDANKLQVLRERQYKINNCCGICAHGNFQPATAWGTCDIQLYTHEKHTGPDRNLSITRYGVCPVFEMKDEALWEFHGFKEFLQ